MRTGEKADVAGQVVPRHRGARMAAPVEGHLRVPTTVVRALAGGRGALHDERPGVLIRVLTADVSLHLLIDRHLAGGPVEERAGEYVAARPVKVDLPGRAG